MQPIDHDGVRGQVEQFNSERLDELLSKPEVKEVAVFNLKAGMTLNIMGRPYKVIAIRPNGKVTMRPK